MSFVMPKEIKIAVMGLGYVGLPLAVAFSHCYETLGFDIKAKRVEALRGGHDDTLEVDDETLSSAKNLTFSSNEIDLQRANIFIVTVPTPVDSHRRPDLTPLLNVSAMIGRVIKSGDVVIFESTVYPGATEEDCIPVIEQVSGLSFNRDFFAGYSPERVNPGDKARPIEKITKVTSGSTPEVADFVDHLYRQIITAGTHKASSIRVAEAAKIIENTQRDVNIALINELAMIFGQMGIDTHDVIEAAATKWNFIKLQPGLVGGHCIGVDPYYLLHKSMSVGYIPDMIRTAREINDGMSRYVASKLIKAMIDSESPIKAAKVLVMGFTFKENCPDIRNTKVIDLVHELASYGLSLDIFDPWADSTEVNEHYGLSLTHQPDYSHYDAVVLAVAHQQFVVGASSMLSALMPSAVVLDMKGVINERSDRVVRL